MTLMEEEKWINLETNIASLEFVFELHWNRCSNKSGKGVRFKLEQPFE